MKTYRVTARRAGDWWALEVPSLPGVFSQTKRLDKAEGAAREAISVMLGAEPGDIEVSIETELPEEARQALKQAERAKQAAAEAAEAERRAMRRAAEVLTRDLSQRDAGRVMGLSFQRVSQLLGADAAAHRTRRTGSARRAKKRVGG
ncbi:type II toxin-antitoxin system HicB family antitoxin [Streptomyces sp. S07_1.15]|uniref:type II toxin-antitoxin system HicB family antitoxin n=1 Tax=Streptomyces sp. S07_1.15 TaxID=2873925 RepID=UPI001D13D9F1|nr:type II toxin-antitoxin system HicB family antitoxin [Streptomyces sp. S07_1.15]MCC3655135.1 type II toxin-antitoxin system HicB family antitoxin [Streptomyces sp. S07_1.15]